MSSFFLEDAHRSGIREISPATSQLTHSLACCDVRADESSSGKFAPNSTSDRIATLRTPRPQSTRQRLNTVDFDSTRWQLGDVRSTTCTTQCFRAVAFVTPRRSTVRRARRCASRAASRCRSRSPPATKLPASATCVLTTSSTVPAFASRRRVCADGLQKGCQAVRVFSSARGEWMMPVTPRGFCLMASSTVHLIAA